MFPIVIGNIFYFYFYFFMLSTYGPWIHHYVSKSVLSFDLREVGRVSVGGSGLVRFGWIPTVSALLIHNSMV